MLPSGKHKDETLAIVHRVLSDIGTRPFDAQLEFQLNRRFGFSSVTFDALGRLLNLGVEEGWVGYAPVEGWPDYKRGRIAEPATETMGMSVESALMSNVKGQYHRHTRGEIDMVIPIDNNAQFCGRGAGWVVYPPGTEHFPTITGGKALIMFFLPGGQNEYKAPPAA
jgi:hypothetical protein